MKKTMKRSITSWLTDWIRDARMACRRNGSQDYIHYAGVLLYPPKKDEAMTEEEQKQLYARLRPLISGRKDLMDGFEFMERCENMMLL